MLAAALVVALVPLLFAWFSEQIWEDYHITFRSSRNLAERHGLVYQPGERVHTFTSPLGVLLPALSFVLTGEDQAALWLFRGLSALALAGGALGGSLPSCPPPSVRSDALSQPAWHRNLAGRRSPSRQRKNSSPAARPAR